MVDSLDQLLPVSMRFAMPLFPWLLLAAGLILGAAMDLHSRRVPNWLCAALLAGGLVARGLVGGWRPALWGLAGAGTAFALLLFPFHRRWLGAGDVKLFIAIGAWLGPLLLGYSLLTSAVFGGLLSAVWIARSSSGLRRQILENLKAGALQVKVPDIEARPARLAPPLAVAIALGTIALVLLYARRLILV
jgi:prepilin peptidase CpaA